MKALMCKNCGAMGLKILRGYLVCEYCDSKFLLEEDDTIAYSHKSTHDHCRSSGKSTVSSITLDDDVERLLRKCREDPRNAKKYANLVLDIDPDNNDALEYL